MASKDRTISGPDADFITPDELRRSVGLPEEIYDRLESDGIVPAPIKASQRTVMHPWRHAVYLSLWLEIFGKDYFARDVEKKKNPGASGG